MSNKAWSTYIQGAEMLYRTRSLRFRDEYREQYLRAMGLKDGMSILEIGCGPGLLCHHLKEWLPCSDITGLDRDKNFVEFAKKRGYEKGIDCTFTKGDAVNLPFSNNSFDACTSHTVIEHVPTEPFLSEQYRVCRPGGVVSIISSRNEAAINPESWYQPSDEEEKLWDMVNNAAKECDEKNKVAAYACSVPDIPRHMERVGFINVSVDFIAVASIPDSSQYDIYTRREFIESNRCIALDAVNLAQNYAPEVWSDSQAQRLRELINSRFDERIRALHEGKKLWDIAVSMLMVTRGYKPE